ncbi:MAG: hypothetical protein HOY79_17455 [Streptomyces sp.]|nr:hypothetical protein [Streptomyces sp.]
MTNIPFPVRVAAVPFRLMGYVVRALLLWAGADPQATAVFGVVFAGTLLAFVTLPPLNRWIGRRVAAYWQRHRSEQARQEPERLEDDHLPGGAHDGHTQILPGVTRLGPTVPLPVRELQRRTRARSIRRRLTRRRPTTSSDRRH